ncbi:MAG: hypothetical protein RMK29_12700 [Myxococcales bacterium]|nr:hypothetical protein [Myxococcota bacterium]MDW8282564.1 hypothetical protein [Myxococcales bacterium]
MASASLRVGSVCLALLVVGCAMPPYFPESEFWQPLSPNAEIDPDSDAYIADLLRARHGGRLSIALDHYNVPIVRPDGATVPVDVALVSPWGHQTLTNVPIPAGAMPAAGSDAHLVVLDEAQGASYEFWRARRTDGRWEASAGVRFDTRGDGVNRAGTGVRASSLSLLLGLITYDEVRRGGPIEHALAWAFDTPNSRFFTPPAASSDGKHQGRPGSIPEGARLRLDPTLDVTTLGLSPVGVRLARALQRYGMFCVDASSDSTLFAEDVRGSGRSWAGLLSWDELHNIPVSRLQVLRIRTKIPIP